MQRMRYTLSGCRTIRKQIHRWMDAPSPATMPETIRDHVGDCADCRSFIKEWNAIEVGLVSIRDHAPSLTAGFASSLDARLSSVRQGSRALWWFRGIAPRRQARFALVAGSAAILAWLCYALSATMMANLSPKGGAGIASSAPSRRPDADTPIPAQIQITPR